MRRVAVRTLDTIADILGLRGSSFTLSVGACLSVGVACRPPDRSPSPVPAWLVGRRGPFGWSAECVYPSFGEMKIASETTVSGEGSAFPRRAWRDRSALSSGPDTPLLACPFAAWYLLPAVDHDGHNGPSTPASSDPPYGSKTIRNRMHLPDGRNVIPQVSRARPPTGHVAHVEEQRPFDFHRNRWVVEVVRRARRPSG